MSWRAEIRMTRPVGARELSKKHWKFLCQKRQLRKAVFYFCNYQGLGCFPPLFLTTTCGFVLLNKEIEGKKGETHCTSCEEGYCKNWKEYKLGDAETVINCELRSTN